MTRVRAKLLLFSGCALILYVMVSLAFFGTTGNYSQTYFGIGADPASFIWFLNWWPWAIAHWLNPFISHFVWYPEGYNMTWATSVPSAALMMFPVTWLANAVVSFNVLTLLAPALSAWTAFLLNLYLTRDVSSSVIGGYLFGFSSYELGELLGHLNLSLIFMAPLFLLLVMLRLRGDLKTVRFVPGLAVALLVQLGLSTEILATSCFFGGVTWIIFFAFAGSAERRLLRVVGWEIILAVGVMTVLAAPFLFFVFQGLADVPSQIHPSEFFGVDPLNYFIPTDMMRIGGTLFASTVNRFGLLSHGIYGAYLGLPLILILILQIRCVGRRPYLKPLLVTLTTLLVLSLGPSLRLAGFTTGLWLPWGLALHLPFIHQALPFRFSLYVSLASALVAALWLSEERGGWNRAGRFTIAALACVFLGPNLGKFRWTPLPLEPFFEPQNVVKFVRRGSNVVILPYDFTGPSLIWQWQSDMAFTQSGGYVGFSPQSAWNWAESKFIWPVLQNFYAGTSGPNFENDISGFCVSHNVSAILIGPGTPAPLAAAIEALGWQQTIDQGVRIVRVPDPQFLRFYYVLGDFWPVDGWMGKEVRIVTNGKPVQLRINGRGRPSKLGPVEIRIVIGSNASSYQITREDEQEFSLPANCSCTLTASSTFMPARIFFTEDRRLLSVALSLHASAVSDEK
ncbi:MAG: hypothetical protein JOY96_10015 [Verrucomicrobia bacterium]|nr:hypothetical protein [Verrucomicrobiota bacterium]